jgi:hypothetical protein
MGDKSHFSSYIHVYTRVSVYSQKLTDFPFLVVTLLVTLFVTLLVTFLVVTLLVAFLDVSLFLTLFVTFFWLRRTTAHRRYKSFHIHTH